MISRWHGEPAWLRATVLVFVGLLAYGTVVHMAQLLASDGHPYPNVPGWLGAYVIALTLLDPLAAVLLARRHRSGVALTVAVLVTDAVANALANYAYDATPGVTVGRIGQAVIICLAFAALATAPAMWRAAAGSKAVS